VISASSFPGTAGDTANYLELLKAFSKKKINITLICPQHSKSKSFDMTMRRDNINVIRIPIQPPRIIRLKRRLTVLHILKLTTFYMAELFTIFAILVRDRYKSAIVRHSLLTVNIPILLKIFKIKTVADGDPVSGSFEEILKTVGVPKFILGLFNTYEKAILSLYTFYLVSTKHNASLLKRLGFPPSRIILRSVAVDVSQIPVYDLKEIPPNTFGYFGALEKWQNVDFLLKTWAEVVGRKTDAKLFIIGDGSSKEYLKNLARKLGIVNNVIFYNAVSREFLWNKYFKLFRVALVPRSPLYFPENPSIKIIEALASGKPVIASSVKGIQEMAVKGMILVPPNDKNAMISAVLSLCEDEDYLMLLSKSSIDSAKQFDINNQIEKLVAILVM
jgi:glycosyltransferase involved in cell wall biosynthesis